MKPCRWAAVAHLGLLTAGLVLLGVVPAGAQSESTIHTPTLAGAAANLEPQSQSDGSALSLGLAEAIERGLRENVAVLLADTAVEAAHGAREEALARLFPHLSGSVSQERLKINLAAFGFPTPAGESPVIGPFNLFDARLSVDQTLYDGEAMARAASARHRLAATRLDATATRQLVAGAVANLYLAALASKAAIEAASAEVATAEANATTAHDRHDTGAAAGIDVVRADLTLSRQKQRLIAARNRYAKDLVALERAIGLELGREIELTDQIPFEPFDAQDLSDALATARAHRPDLASAQANLAASDATLTAARGQRVPSLSAHGDYGSIGSRPGDSLDTFTLRASVHVPLFEGHRIAGEVRRARAQRQAAQLRLEDLEQQLDADVRNALLDLESAAQQVEVSEQGVELANLQLEQTRDRFAAGVGDSLEVSVAQEAVATANAQRVASLYAYGTARVALALSMGTADEELSRFLLGETE